MELNELFKIIDKIKATDFQEAYIKYQDGVISLKRSGPAQVGIAVPSAEGMPDTPSPTPVEAEGDTGVKKIISPITGVFYEAPEPGSAPFISVDENFKRNQVLCIIESMKLMNEIYASEDGVLVEKLVKNGDMVETNQPIFAYKNL